MTRDEWRVQWKRLDPFHVSGDADRGDVSAEWFKQLQHHHVDAVEHGITQLIGHATDTFLPGLGLLKDFIQQRLHRYDRTAGKCATCHGSGWVDAQPWKSNGIVYEGVSRCLDCGIPAPQVNDRKVTHPLTALEDHEYQAGRYNRDLMPEFAKAKPWKNEQARIEHKAAMREAFETLRIKLFGHGEDAA